MNTNSIDLGKVDLHTTKHFVKDAVNFRKAEKEKSIKALYINRQGVGRVLPARNNGESIAIDSVSQQFVILPYFVTLENSTEKTLICFEGVPTTFQPYEYNNGIDMPRTFDPWTNPEKHYMSSRSFYAHMQSNDLQKLNKQDYTVVILGLFAGFILATLLFVFLWFISLFI